LIQDGTAIVVSPLIALMKNQVDAIRSLSSEKGIAHVLNSSLTRLNILNNSRSQGNGLRKIQLYEFKEIKVINIKNISSKSINELEDLGKSLMITNRYDNQQNEIIEQIDIILLNEYNEYNNSLITIEELKNELKEYIK
jgi:superfamily II DNA helicase RecQ